MKPWHFRYARVLIYVFGAFAALGIALASGWGSANIGATLVDARQLFGLWALGFFLASMMLGPLTSVFPWIPFKSSLMYGRRAVGLCAFFFVLVHSACYLWALLLRSWREIYTPGVLWMAGLLLGTAAMACMVALSVTSRDKAVKQMGGRRWKRLHRIIYLALGVILLHSLFVGADFGINRGPDVRGVPDAGAGITFICISTAWLFFFILRHRGVRWTPRFLRPSPPASLQ